jgi:RHS repeat-associated protein
MPSHPSNPRPKSYSFGSSINTRSFSASSGFRFGFNAKENFDQYQDYGFRIYYPNLGKFLSKDPLDSKFPWYSSYQFSGNKCLSFIDIDGTEEFIAIYNWVGKDKVRVDIYTSEKLIEDQVKHKITIENNLALGSDINPYFQTVDNFISMTYYEENGSTRVSLWGPENMLNPDDSKMKNYSETTSVSNLSTANGSNTNSPPFSMSWIFNVKIKSFSDELPTEFLSAEKTTNSLEAQDFKIGPSTQPVRLLGTLFFDNIPNDVQIKNSSTGDVIYEAHNVTNTVDISQANIYINGNTNITIGVKPSNASEGPSDGWSYNLAIKRTKDVEKLVEITSE